jgi:hypothetical protein
MDLMKSLGKEEISSKGDQCLEGLSNRGLPSRAVRIWKEINSRRVDKKPLSFSQQEALRK